jgi:hypothetical protein
MPDLGLTLSSDTLNTNMMKAVDRAPVKRLKPVRGLLQFVQNLARLPSNPILLAYRAFLEAAQSTLPYLWIHGGAPRDQLVLLFDEVSLGICKKL